MPPVNIGAVIKAADVILPAIGHNLLSSRQGFELIAMLLAGDDDCVAAEDIIA